MIKKTKDCFVSMCRNKIIIPLSAMLLGSLMLVITLFLPFGTAIESQREYLENYPDKIWSEEADMTNEEAIDISLFESAIIYSHSSDMGMPEYIIITIMISVLAVFAILTLLFSILRKPIPSIIFSALSFLVFLIVKWDFKDRSIIPSSKYDLGSAQVFLFISVFLVIGGSIAWIVMSKFLPKHNKATITNNTPVEPNVSAPLAEPAEESVVDNITKASEIVSNSDESNICNAIPASEPVGEIKENPFKTALKWITDKSNAIIKKIKSTEKIKIGKLEIDFKLFLIIAAALVVSIVILAIILCAVNCSGGNGNVSSNTPSGNFSEISDDNYSDIQDINVTQAKPTGETGTYKDFCYAVLDNNSIEITQYTGSENHVTIPSEIDGKPVIHIGKSAFENCTFIEDLNIWADIKIIDDNAFKGCSNLSRINISSENELIGKSAFEDCTSLESVNFWSGKIIDENAFKGCTSIDYLSIPSEVKLIGKSAFENCTGIETLNIWGTETIGESAFKGCTSIDYLSIPSEVKLIGKSAFENCTGIETLNIWGTETIGESAFRGCTGIERLSIPSETKFIGDYAFYGCTNLKYVNIWGDDTALGTDVFGNCPNLEQ